MILTFRTKRNEIIKVDSNNIIIEVDLKNDRLAISDSNFNYIDDDCMNRILLKWFLELNKFYFDKEYKFKEIKIDLINNGFRIIKHDDTYLEKILIKNNNVIDVKVSIEGNTFIRPIYIEIERLNKINLF